MLDWLLNVWTLLLLAILYLIFGSWRPFYFKRLGVPGPTPLPLFGTIIPLFSKGFVNYDREVFKKYGNIVGTFEGSTPCLLAGDPDMLREIMIKQFNNFPNRRKFLTGDPANDLMLTQLDDDHWKHIRNVMTPTFSGGKLKIMMKQINECGQQLTKNLEKEAETNAVVDVRDAFGAFTLDVIASTSFGIKLDSLLDKNNPFVQHAKKAFKVELTNPAVMLFFFAPSLFNFMRKIGVNMAIAPPRDVRNFFVDIIDQAIAGRKTTKNGGVDFLQLMLNVSDNGEMKEVAEDEKNPSDSQYSGYENGDTTWNRKGMTKDEVLAQSLIFMLAGYETTASTMSFLAYWLALNPDCQDKLYEEVKELMGNKEFFDYETTNKTPYMDMCIKETLRICPPAIRMDRIASNDAVVNGIRIPKGTLIGLPIYGVHHNPQFWSEPEKFDPERFTPENMASMHPFQYLPFGAGPRNCIGMRLAQLEIKAAISLVIRQFRFVPCEKTEIPLMFKKAGLLQTENGISLKVEKR